MKFVFADGESLGVYTDGKAEKFDSAYITHYRESALKQDKNREWKKNTDMMMYEDYFGGAGEGAIRASIHAVALTNEANKFLYAFSINETSGVYYKYTDDEKKTESHALSSNEVTFLSLTTTVDGDILGAVQTDTYRAKIAVFSRDGGDYKTLTDGDSFDENPSFDSEGNIVFNSYAIGRDGNNVFVQYMPSEIYRLNVRSMEVEELLSDKDVSYIKPIVDKNGALYCIKKAGSDKEKGNPLMEILLIPYRIIQAIVGFISTFVMCFAGKPMVNGKGRTPGGDSMAKNAPDRDIYIHNQIVNVEKEMKKNAKSKSEDYGFIPRSWKLAYIPKASNEGGRYALNELKELASGVADFCIVEENGEEQLIYTNGKHVFALKKEGEEWKKRKLLDTEFCLKVGGIRPALNNATEEVFDRF